jgi:hypothetical protein
MTGSYILLQGTEQFRAWLPWFNQIDFIGSQSLSKSWPSLGRTKVVTGTKAKDRIEDFRQETIPITNGARRFGIGSGFDAGAAPVMVDSRHSESEYPAALATEILVYSQSPLQSNCTDQFQDKGPPWD